MLKLNALSTVTAIIVSTVSVLQAAARSEARSLAFDLLEGASAPGGRKNSARVWQGSALSEKNLARKMPGAGQKTTDLVP